MKSIRVASLAAIASLACSTVLADCAFPKAPAAIPDGKVATEAEMIEAMKAFKTYNEEVNAFGACLEEETRSKAAGSTAQLMHIKSMQMKKHKAAVNELQSKAALFNEQVRIFKTRG